MARRWFKIGAGAGAGVTTIIGLFLLLTTLYGFEITGTDAVCKGTLEDPCISYISVYNPNSYDVDVYNQNEVKLSFDPQVPEFYLFRKDGRCRGGSSCAAPNGISLRGWNYIDFTEATKPIANKKYVYRFPAKTTKEFLLWGLKDNPTDTIKWTFFTEKGELDPFWFPPPLSGITLTDKNITTLIAQLNYTANTSFVNYTCSYNETNLSWITCWNYDTAPAQTNTTNVYFYQELSVNNNTADVTAWGAWCWNDGIIWCKDRFDGDGDLEQPGLKPGMTYFNITNDSFYTDGHRGTYYLDRLKGLTG